ncbi:MULTISPECIES: polysaccharide deacetylase family protein [Streptomyces]|uniref:Polysaccharide deacetylase family protein n=1 Tax=Streptomyces glycanivorans TaxID=3033808 RepID=A0ABY9JS52_9ACTN|nr:MULTISPECIES: polysaccharide deacetylase family protein [unclassified Streptomyces]WLQ68866.1 polysaccharide deacetylase family protein [Streptomyces sp. Alt3]WSR11452.1 polysaccharide deacetylase family protein [Streptomyces sp. NBC_01208]
MIVLTVMGGVLAGCASPEATRAGTAVRPTASEKPATGPTAAPSPPRAPSRAPESGPPVLAPGPGGLTPVFERRATGSTGRDGAGAADKVVALTFDADMTADQGQRAAEGEHFDNPGLIASLRRLEVPSTVFMTGRWAQEYPDQARSIGTDPLFEIANHSFSHHAFSSPCYGLPTVAAEDMRADVERAFTAIRKTGARHVVPYFRFPGGCYDDASLKALAPTGVTAVQWDVVSGDAFATDADAVAEQVLEGVEPGSLVVMHCTRSAAPVTDDALRRIVPELRERGYRFVKVSELMRG